MSVDRNECGLSDAAWEGLHLIWCWIHQAFYIGEPVSSPNPCLSWLCADFRGSVSGSPAEEGSSDENRVAHPLYYLRYICFRGCHLFDCRSCLY